MNLFKKISIIISLLCCVALLTHCKKPDPGNDWKPYSLPPITKEGLGTFGCLMDGKLWKPNGHEPKSTSAYYDYSDHSKLKGLLNLVGENQKFSNAETVDILKVNLWDTGMYRLRSTKHISNQSGYYDNGYIYLACDCPDLTKDKIYESDSLSYGWLHIHHLDTNNRIIAGTFEFDAINEKDITDTIKIRKGRFDHKY